MTAIRGLERGRPRCASGPSPSSASSLAHLKEPGGPRMRAGSGPSPGPAEASLQRGPLA